MAATVTIAIDGQTTPIVFTISDIAVSALTSKVAASGGQYTDAGALLIAWYQPLLAQAVAANPPSDVAGYLAQAQQLQQQAASELASLTLVTRVS
jgi:hypothetical protein